MKLLLFIGILFLFSLPVYGQGCSTRGQTPETAFPVCGTSVFVQDSVPACVNNIIPVTGCSFDNVKYSDQSPFWYKFTCFKSGSLGFLITPFNNQDDYDWQLFDITGHKPGEVYSDPSLFVSGNWSGEGGNTGASKKGKTNLVCATLRNSPYRPLFSSMPQIIKGHKYLLLVSHFSGSSQSGYKLSFKGGTAVITDTTSPRMEKAVAECDGRSITLFLNKEMRCGSLAADGSDFKLLNTTVGVASAFSKSCKSGFDMQQLTLQLDGKLKPGKYTVVIRQGSDGNTLLDNCGTGIPVGDTVQFVLQKIYPTPMDSVVALGCSPQSIEVVFAGDIRCSSVANDGSDFSIVNTATGIPLAITGAAGVQCDSNRSHIIKIDLAQPIYTKGNYHLTLRKGTDGNTVLSACEVASVAGQVLTFNSYDTVSARINPTVRYQCNEAEVQLVNPGDNEINEWNWTTSAGHSGTADSLTFVDTSFTTQKVTLKVSNGVCSDVQMKTLKFDQAYYIHAAFDAPPFVCPQDPVLFVDKSEGKNIIQWNWDFGDGKYAYRAAPDIQHYPVGTFTKKYNVSLMVTNSRGCKDTATGNIKVINTCEVYVPTAFTPNGDGQNDYLYPLNAYLAKDLIFKVYNRYGQLVFKTKDWTKGWDGTFHGKPQPTGSYVWELRFVNSKTQRKVFRKGAALLIR